MPIYLSAIFGRKVKPLRESMRVYYLWMRPQMGVPHRSVLGGFPANSQQRPVLIRTRSVQPRHLIRMLTISRLARQAGSTFTGQKKARHPEAACIYLSIDDGRAIWCFCPVSLGFSSSTEYQNMVSAIVALKACFDLHRRSGMTLISRAPSPIRPNTQIIGHQQGRILASYSAMLGLSGSRATHGSKAIPAVAG